VPGFFLGYAKSQLNFAIVAGLVSGLASAVQPIPRPVAVRSSSTVPRGHRVRASGGLCSKARPVSARVSRLPSTQADKWVERRRACWRSRSAIRSGRTVISTTLRGAPVSIRSRTTAGQRHTWASFDGCPRHCRGAKSGVTGCSEGNYATVVGEISNTISIIYESRVRNSRIGLPCKAFDVNCKGNLERRLDEQTYSDYTRHTAVPTVVRQ
jgi:hypothetical protein